MDISFDTIIYIILGLIFVFAQVAKNKRKKAQAQASENEGDSVPDPPRAPSILEQMLGIPDEKDVVEKPVENKHPHLVDPDPSFLQSGPGESYNRTVNEPVEQSLKVKGDPNVWKNKLKSGRKAKFNLKQAVIYKTILERKKY